MSWYYTKKVCPNDKEMSLFDVNTLEEVITNKRRQMHELLTRLEDEILWKFEKDVANARNILKRTNGTRSRNEKCIDTCESKYTLPLDVGGSDGCLTDVCLPMTDAINHTFASVAHLFADKELFNHVIANVQEYSAKVTGTPEDRKKAKEMFDIICKYSERSFRVTEDVQCIDTSKSQNSYNTGHYYRELSMCQYLIHKTFKKSALGSYESYFRILPLVEGICRERLRLSPPMEEDQCSKQIVSFSIAALGGGPASDLTGSISFLFPTVHRVWRQTVLNEKIPRNEAVEAQMIRSPSATSQTTAASATLLHRALLVQLDCCVYDLNPTSFMTAATPVLQSAFSSFNTKKGNSVTAVSTGFVNSIEEWEKKVAALYKKQISRQNSLGKEPIADSTSVHFTFIKKDLNNNTSTSDRSSGDSESADVTGEVYYEFINFLDPSSIPVKLLQQTDFVTTCWALNEASFSRIFWETILFEATQKAVLIFVEGKSDDLVEINKIAQGGINSVQDKQSILTRDTVFDMYENPRRLFVLPLMKNKCFR